MTTSKIFEAAAEKFSSKIDTIEASAFKAGVQWSIENHPDVLKLVEACHSVIKNYACDCPSPTLPEDCPHGINSEMPYLEQALENFQATLNRNEGEK